MRVGTFYLSTGRVPPRLKGDEAGVFVALPRGGHVYIRIVDGDARGVIDALDTAQPRPGEHVMNTHALPRLRGRR